MIQKSVSIIVVSIAMIAVCGSSVHAADWYVDQSVSRSGDGTRWEKAFETITEAINAANEGDVIHVAEGAYYSGYPYLLNKIISLYGGYSKTNRVRNPQLYETILRRGIELFLREGKGDMAIDGFTIMTEGAGTGINNSRAPLSHLINITIKNCTIKDNFQGITLHGTGNGNVLIINSIVDHNVTGVTVNYGRYSNQDIGAILRSTLIINNLESGLRGTTSRVILQNCTVSNNGKCGIEILHWSSWQVINSIISNNKTYGIKGTGAPDFSLDISYSDVWGNLLGDYFNWPPGTTLPQPGVKGNISEDSKFVGGEPFDYHLRFDSPCINAGIDIGLPYYGAAPDMGAYEFGLFEVIGTIINSVQNITKIISELPNLTQGEQNSLTTKLENVIGKVMLAINYYKEGKINLAINQLNTAQNNLNAFINEIQAGVNSGEIDPETGNNILSQTEYIINLIEQLKIEYGLLRK